MNTMDVRPVASSTAPLVPQRLELAPEGWRACVEQVAQGFTYMKAGIVFCEICGCELRRGSGHDVTCLTMGARRIIAEEPRLRADRVQTALAELFFLEVDIDAAHSYGCQLPAAPGRAAT